jgi:hypothetical protein
MYVNLALAAKKCLDAIKIKTGVQDARKTLLNLYDELPIHEDFKDVDETDFFELSERHRNARKGKQQPKAVLAANYQSIGVPPPKSPLA